MFNFEDYKDTDYCMYCATYDEAKDFCEFMDEHGMTWNDGKSYLDEMNYHSTNGGTVYYFNKGMFGSFNLAKKYAKHIFNWSDFNKGSMVVDLL